MSDLVFSLASIKAVINDFDNGFALYKYVTIPPIIRIKTDNCDVYSSDYHLPIKKSTRGRHKKPKVERKKFKFNLIFIIRLYIHRPPKRDVLSQTSQQCTIHDNCEVCAKSYTIRIFNGGKLVCVGIKKHNKQDFYECAEIVRRYLARYKTIQYYQLDLHPVLLQSIFNYFYRCYEIINVKSTLENYQFVIPKNINLYKLKDKLINQSKDRIINVDYNILYKYLTDCIQQKSYEINVEWLLKTLTLDKTVRKNFVDRERFRIMLSQIDLKHIELKYTCYWNDFYQRNKYQISYNYIDHINYTVMKLYITEKIKKMSCQCDILDNDTVESVLFKEAKNTLIVKKKIYDRSITYRIFISGVINIQGSNSYEIALDARNKILEIITPELLYDPREPPMLSWQNILGVNNIISDSQSLEFDSDIDGF